MSVVASAVHRAALLRESGRPADAMAILGPYLAATPDDAEALRQAGFCLLALGRTEDAHRHAARLLALAPDSGSAHLLMAAVLIAEQNFPDARQATAAAMRAAPHSSVPYQMAVSIDLQAEQVGDQTEQLARTAVQLDPHDGDAHRLLGTTLLQRKRWDQARASFEQALAIDPADRLAAGELARVDLQQGRSGAAASRLSHALRSDPTNAVLSYNLRVAAFNAFARAQLVLWFACLIAFQVFPKDGHPAGEDPFLTVRIIAPLAVLAALGMWAWELRRSRRQGIAAIARAVRRDRTLTIGVGLHFATLALFLVSVLLPYDAMQAGLTIGSLTLVATSILSFVCKSQLKKSMPG